MNLAPGRAVHSELDSHTTAVTAKTYHTHTHTSPRVIERRAFGSSLDYELYQNNRHVYNTLPMLGNQMFCTSVVRPANNDFFSNAQPELLIGTAQDICCLFLLASQWYVSRIAF